MSNQYKHGDKVPSEVLCKRLNELSDAVTKGRAAVLREFDMRIPAELDRDADIVLSEAARRIADLEARLAEVESAEPDYWVSVDGVYVDFGMRSPGAEDDGANWCARTEVNQHINDRMLEHPGLRLHLEPLYRHPPTERAVPEITGDTSDGYHTFNELYEFRKVYNAALFNEWAAAGKYNVHKSWRHHDGEDCFGGGWFIVVAVLPTGQISNHYAAEDWGLFNVPECERAKFEFDGHTSEDVLLRLKSLAAAPGAGGDEYAFPQPHSLQMGITLRDYFAGQALQGFLASIGVTSGNDPTDADIARYSYDMADAMLEARNITAPSAGGGE